ncbi:iron ABC transporter permease [Proteinivorax tanatarense]|uniref:Iron ABC transporter permease n=1 Tax=Proteinivorax tanatarense TaxID=1260629 RepID=A0AAU7VLA7_9FIRM
MDNLRLKIHQLVEDVKVRSFLRAFKLFLQRIWTNIWYGESPGWVLLVLGLGISIVMAFPIIYVVINSLFAGADRWLRLLDDRVPGLLWNTLSLTFVVTFMAVTIGVILAWLVQRCDLPGRKMWRWILALPLVIPPYVGAVAYISIFGPAGWFRDVLGQSPFDIYSFWGVVFVLTMFTYPYVFLITSSSLKKMNRNFEDAARSLGMNTAEIFWKVNLPFLRPAIGAGAILIALYVLSDFGAIAMLRYNTFTAAIYYQIGGFDNVSATVLSVMLIGLTVAILWLESKGKKKRKYYQSANSHKKPDILPLGKFKWPALILTSLIFIMSVVLPIAVLLYWARLGIAEGALDYRFWGFALNSLKVSSIAALVSMILSVPIIYLKSRYPSIITTVIDKLSYSGYALPGVIVALGLIFVFSQHIPWLYNTYMAVAIAYIIRFMPQAMQSGESSLSLVSPKMDESARSLGLPSWQVLFKVIIPQILPGILAGGALVFVSSLKELPATLALRPPGFDTLSVRVWIEATEAIYHMAAPAALIIIAVSLIPLRWMLSKY